MDRVDGLATTGGTPRQRRRSACSSTRESTRGRRTPGSSSNPGHPLNRVSRNPPPATTYTTVQSGGGPPPCGKLDLVRQSEPRAIAKPMKPPESSLPGQTARTGLRSCLVPRSDEQHRFYGAPKSESTTRYNYWPKEPRSPPSPSAADGPPASAPPSDTPQPPSDMQQPHLSDRSSSEFG